MSDESKTTQEDPDVQVGLRVPRDLLERFDTAVDRHHLQRSGCIRWAMEEWLEAHSGGPGAKASGERQG